MTTNHLSALDPALIRPGRVDLIELFDDASPAQARRLFLQFYGEDSSGGTNEQLFNTADRLENLVREELGRRRRISMASLQGIFIRNSAADAVDICKEAFVSRE